jgi:hypothetical protein
MCCLVSQIILHLISTCFLVVVKNEWFVACSLIALSFEDADFWFAFVHKIAVLVLTRCVSR